MNFRRSLRMSIILLAVAAGSPAAPASAEPPLELKGSYQIVGGAPGTERATGNVVHTTFVLYSTVSGDFVSAVGTPVVTEYDCITVTGRSISCRAEETFTGTIKGIGAGTTVARAHVKCDLTTGMCAGSSTTRGGSGDLADVRGTVRFEGRILASGTYTARLNQY